MAKIEVVTVGHGGLITTEVMEADRTDKITDGSLEMVRVERKEYKGTRTVGHLWWKREEEISTVQEKEYCVAAFAAGAWKSIIVIDPSQEQNQPPQASEPAKK